MEVVNIPDIAKKLQRKIGDDNEQRRRSNQKGTNTEHTAEYQLFGQYNCVHRLPFKFLQSNNRWR